ncbi:MAG: redoxin domain-containing protein [Planctomycetota bacterium]
MSIRSIPSFVFLSALTALLPAQRGEPAATPAATPAENPAATQKDPEAKVLQLGQRPDRALSLRDLDGEAVTAESLLGKVVVVNFYSIQCPVQRAWDRRLADIQRFFTPQGVVFLHIDSNVTEIGAEPPKPVEGEQPYARIREHLKEQDLPFRVLVDHGNAVADLFGATSTPHVYVFGPHGRLIYRGLVDDDQRDRNQDGRTEYLRTTLTRLLAGEEVEPFATKEVGCSIKRVGKGSGRGRGARRGSSDGGSSGGDGDR